MVERLVQDGVEPIAVMVDLVAAVQRRVGQRWADGTWSVAQEHAATAIATSALGHLLRELRDYPLSERLVREHGGSRR